MWKWDDAIGRNREAIAGIVTMLLNMWGDVEMTRISRVYFLVVATVRAAESALRRVIYTAALKRIAEAKASSKGPTEKRTLPDFSQFAKTAGESFSRFRLVDPRKPVRSDDFVWLGSEEEAEFLARCDVLPHDAKPGAEPQTFSLAHMQRRLSALDAAIAKFSQHVRRMERLLQRLNAPRGDKGKALKSPLRPGLPPGLSKKANRHRDEAETVLYECQGLAEMAEADFARGVP